MPAIAGIKTCGHARLEQRVHVTQLAASLRIERDAAVISNGPEPLQAQHPAIVLPTAAGRGSKPHVDRHPQVRPLARSPTRSDMPP